MSRHSYIPGFKGRKIKEIFVKKSFPHFDSDSRKTVKFRYKATEIPTTGSFFIALTYGLDE